MIYQWSHPVAALPSDEGENMSLLQNDVNSANQCPFFGYQPPSMSMRLDIAAQKSEKNLTT
eukprot:1427815-Pleurochrysis_carterae.AAC.1